MAGAEAGAIVAKGFLSVITGAVTMVVTSFIAGVNGFFEGFYNFLYNRLRFYYTLHTLDRQIVHDYCRLYFGYDSQRSRLKYEMECPNISEISDGHVRIGEDGVDVWDRMAGQDKVAISGFIPIPNTL